eukprot:CAMPEP_0197575868 /NCGR_PEP_ID=MMETSP1326-20131121/1104_1 /TAXON_ID=1155430 /ORGANISM="Genus nov. species nov., Strain RCC2288" /LENGTH=43 /DNA_ID= /DNA_START= /DNA_END= /DNA_ORIENTATION=
MKVRLLTPLVEGAEEEAGAEPRFVLIAPRKVKFLLVKPQEAEV